MAAYRVVAPHFVAGFETRGGGRLLEVVTHAAPILKYMIGWRPDRVRDYCLRKGWEFQRVDSEGSGGPGERE